MQRDSYKGPLSDLSIHHSINQLVNLSICLSTYLPAYLPTYGSTAPFEPWPFFQFVNPLELLERGISPSQGLYLHTEQHKQNKRTRADTHALSGIRTHDPRVRAREDSGHCDRLNYGTIETK
jgi:hypothetical protein